MLRAVEGCWPVRGRICACLSALLLLLAGCVAAPSIADVETDDPPVADHDPIGPVNRLLYAVNVGIEYAFVGPLTYAYRYVVPQPVRNAVGNVLDNASGPVVAANHVMQGKFCRAGDTALRFLINTTIGLGGSIDVAGKMAIPAQRTDFGVTLGRWGVPAGPYLYLPVLTSSDLRDLGGLAVDIAIDPWSWGFSGVPIDDADWGRLSGQIVDTTERWIDEVRRIKTNDIDPYAGYRSMYLQYRRRRIESARAPDNGVVCGDEPRAE